ncbi:hypothetical protein BH11PSE11_BH11PSE11_20180 [soil metagenome]
MTGSVPFVQHRGRLGPHIMRLLRRAAVTYSAQASRSTDRHSSFVFSRIQSLFGQLSSSLRAAMALALVSTALCAAPAYAFDERVALVIGNDSYPGGPLKNAVNDAQQVAKMLTALGFKVVVRTNADFTTMRAAAVEFANLLDNNHAAVFYFAGHGIQYRGKNYLVPVDARLTSETEVVFNALEVTQILERMQDANVRHKFLILDACRNNPFRAVFGSSATQGLARMQTPPGTTVAFAAQTGAVAEDGKGENGVYTKSLLRELSKPDLQAGLMFQQVSQAVQTETFGRQTPEVQSVAASKGIFFFNDSRMSSQEAAAANSANPVARASADTEAKVDLEFWSNVKDSARAEDYRAYLDQFPNGRFASLARGRMDSISRQKPPSTPAVPVALGPAPAAVPVTSIAANVPPPILVADARGIEAKPSSSSTASEPPAEKPRADNDRIAAHHPGRSEPSSASDAAEELLQSGEIDQGNGNRYVGQYREVRGKGKVFHGKGEYTGKDFRYTGEFKDGKKHGRGEYKFPNGDIFDGDFSSDVPNGKGRYQFASGDTYEGEIVAGRISGMGVYMTRGMDRIEGNFTDAKANGHVLYQFANGDKYDGEMVGGRMSGKGVYTIKSQDRIVGTFVDGQAQGEGVYFFANSDRYEGQIKAGALTGKGKYFYSNGMRSEGEFVNGVLKGKGTFHFNDGSSFEGEFTDGLKNARGVSILKDGSKREAVIVDNTVKFIGG